MQETYNELMLNYDNYDSSLVKQFLNGCTTLDVTLINSRDKMGNTALHIACTYSDVYVVKYLINNGAYVDIINNNGWTPLRIASHFGSLDIVNMLIDKCDINATDNNKSALYFASLSCHDAVVSRLINRHAQLKINGVLQFADNWKRSVYLSQYA
jgi:ankyrin repeat protein